MAFEVPNLTLLRQFVVAAEEGGISRAAKRLNISQPALSKNIRKLEEMLETQLFERHSSGTDLTRSGQALLERAHIIGLEYQHALQDIRNIRSDQESTIRIAAGPIWTHTVLPLVAERFHTLFPRHKLHVQTDSVENLTDDLRLGRIDIFAGALVSRSTPPGFTVRNLARADLVVFASEDHPLARTGGKVPLDALADYPFVAFIPSYEIVDIFSGILRRHDARPVRVVLETSSIYACVELTLTGKYLYYETNMIAHSEMGKKLAILQLEVPPLQFDIGIVFRDGLDRIPQFSRLMKIMAEVLQSVLAPQATGRGDTAEHNLIR